jgi:hypothetical protein
MPKRRLVMAAVTIIGLILAATTAFWLTGGGSAGVLAPADVAVPAAIPATLLVVFTLMSRRR